MGMGRWEWEVGMVVGMVGGNGKREWKEGMADGNGRWALQVGMVGENLHGRDDGWKWQGKGEWQERETREKKEQTDLFHTYEMA